MAAHAPQALDAASAKGAGAQPCPSRARPIDLVHLTRRTLGDLALEREVLGLMQRQILAFADRLDLATDDERRQIAHALKGSARNVGAFSLAAAADAVEAAPDSRPARATLDAEMRRASVFIRSIGG